jgi:pyruvate ferredoxin oxidoreductase beta subunit
MPELLKERDKFVDHLLCSGHTACPGCGQSIAARLVVRAAGRNVIIINSTGCLEIFTSKYPESAWEVPWLHSLFQNTAAVASGVEAALRSIGRLDKVRVIAQGGDGSTFDIGFGAISGMFERGHDILYVCYDNEAYMNTGIQRSGSTPTYARTTTSPPGKVSLGNLRPKKDMPQIAAAHGIPYVAVASVGYPMDLDRKVRKALSIRGPKYVQIHVPCPLGWGTEPSRTIDYARLAVNTGLYPLYEVEDGVTMVVKIPKRVPVEEYLKGQVRFRHLLEGAGRKQEIAEIQKLADQNIEKFGLIAE